MNKRLNLIFNIDKEENIPSFKIVKRFRDIFKEKKVGFLGTLDPFASGVLPLFSGNFTKLIRYLEGCDKVYDAKIEFGLLTDTFDITGKVVEKRSKILNFDSKEIEKVIEKFFLGERLQIVPDYSATKIDGVRSYKLARKGFKLEERRKKVILKEFTLKDFDGKYLNVRIRVSKGFYVRSFAKELGEKLDTFGTVVSLKRIENGPFKIDDAKRIEDVKIEDSKLPEEILQEYMDTVELDGRSFEVLMNGNSLKYECQNQKSFLVKNERGYIVVESDGGSIYPKRCII
ncbi:MAG: tRNA pseudouridine synthase B [candidate division TA06 bacterium 32_111]|uniref:tRNA pseudouridine synthase B n=1 Tax=candidate division TA06 bacterium 34_109 TaxID=1635277 RepID=A0A117M776_UNCT6|nr:MAG: tRNA pseudouridine synthase B [candidate division TA06 bacterium 32_111]KUK88152.1 MAG: tRNA pseudouridine synthase B [candidate division TA06 bacterium 34_109]